MIGKDLWEKSTRDAIDARELTGTSAGEFLNYQFGWAPIVGDAIDFVKAVRTMDKLLQQYARDNGNVVRRRLTLPPETKIEETVVSSNTFPRLGLNSAQFFSFGSPTGQVVRRRETTVRRWFSGAFVYHLPQTFFAAIYTPYADKFQIYRKIFGLELTPDTLWQLTPWSWAIDWFTSVGDVINNASAWANDGLVMKYGYIMEHSIVHDTYTFVGPTRILTDSQVVTRPPDVTLVTETKLRRRANPFGFGLSMDGLSDLQKTILAAVGLSRKR
jgi:hypothetical protein